MIRFPLAPLRQHLNDTLGPPMPGSDQAGATSQAVADQLGITPRAWLRICARGDLTEVDADRYATALGVHPSMIWPDLYALAAAS